jgi:hypothetical protein
MSTRLEHRFASRVSCLDVCNWPYLKVRFVTGVKRERNDHDDQDARLQRNQQ